MEAPGVEPGSVNPFHTSVYVRIWCSVSGAASKPLTSLPVIPSGLSPESQRSLPAVKPSSDPTPGYAATSPVLGSGCLSSLTKWCKVGS